ncbi:MAG: hypothetical protein WD669_12200 [Pirellulales bacterium]
MIAVAQERIEMISIPPATRRWERAEAEPFWPEVEPEEPSELEDPNIPCTDDDPRWDVFLPDDDPYEPLPEPGDFWIDVDGE